MANSEHGQEIVILMSQGSHSLLDIGPAAKLAWKRVEELR